MKICFIVYALNVGSAFLRGYQITESLARHNIKADILNWPDLAIKLSCEKSLEYNIFIFVKEWSQDLAGMIKKKSKGKIIIDIVDNYQLHDEFTCNKVSYDLADLFIVPTTYQKILLTQRFLNYKKKPVWVIPHNHTNFYNLINDVTRPVNCIGFQGTISNRLPKTLEKKLKNFCKSHKIKWRNFFIQEIKLLYNFLPISKINQLIQHQLDSIDIGIIFPPDNSGIKNIIKMEKSTMELILFKPATRLVNFLSHGIPTICYPYTSYLEVCVSSGYPLFCSDEDSLFNWLQLLIEDVSLRSNISKKGLEIANKYSLEQIVLYYRDYLLTLK